MFKLQGTKLHMNIAYHSEFNGQTEVLIKTLETCLWCFSSEQEHGQNSYRGLNTSTILASRVLPTTLPLRLCMIDHPILSKDYTRRSLWGSCSPRSKGQGIKVLVEALRQLKFHLRRAQDLMTHYENECPEETNQLCFEVDKNSQLFFSSVDQKCPKHITKHFKTGKCWLRTCLWKSTRFNFSPS